MKLKNVFTLMSILAGPAFVTGCSTEEASKGSDDEKSYGVDDLTKLPAITGAIDGSGLRSARALNPNQNSSRAETGLALSDFGQSWTGKSAAMCNVGRFTSQILGSAADADKIRCYVGVMQKHDLFEDLGSKDRYVIYGVGDGRVKFKVGKNSEGKFNKFEMFSCMGQTPDVQDSYIDYEINDDGSVDVKNVVNGSFSVSSGGGAGGSTFTGEFSGRTLVSGDFDPESGSWKSKKITAQSGSSFEFDSSDNNYDMLSVNNQHVQFRQTESSVATLQGYLDNSFTIGGSSTDFDGAFKAKFEVLNTDSLEDYAIGDGSFYFTNDGGDTEQSGAWTGDDSEDANSEDVGSHLEGVDELDYITSLDGDEEFTTAVEFSEDESWDCSGEAVAEISLEDAFADEDVAADMQACDDQYQDPQRDNQGGINCGG